VDSETDQNIYIDNNKLLSIYKSRDGTSQPLPSRDGNGWSSFILSRTIAIDQNDLTE